MNARQRRADKRAAQRYLARYAETVCLGCHLRGLRRVDEDGLCTTCGCEIVVVTGPCGRDSAQYVIDALKVPATVSDIVRSQKGLGHVTVASDFALLSKLVRTIGRDRRQAPRWSHVGAYLGHGSGVSQAICRALELDPDELVGNAGYESDANDADADTLELTLKHAAMRIRTRAERYPTESLQALAGKIASEAETLLDRLMTTPLEAP